MKKATSAETNHQSSPAKQTSAKSTRVSKPSADLSRYPDRWFKAPVKGHCLETGLTRAAFYQLATTGKIRTACIKKPGAIRGCRLFHLGSILAFLDTTAEESAAREENSAPRCPRCRRKLWRSGRCMTRRNAGRPKRSPERMRRQKKAQKKDRPKQAARRRAAREKAEAELDRAEASGFLTPTRPVDLFSSREDMLRAALRERYLQRRTEELIQKGK